MKTEDTYRLEYNFEQKCFHHNYGQHEPESYGWITVFESITRIEDYFFCSVLESLYNDDELDEEKLFHAKELSIKLFNYLINNGFDPSARIGDISTRTIHKREYRALCNDYIQI